MTVTNWKEKYSKKKVSVEKATEVVQSGDRVWTPPAANFAHDFMDELVKRYEELENVTIVTGFMMRPCEHLKPQYRGSINHHAFFMGPIERKAYEYGNVEVTSYQFCESDWVSENRMNTNVMVTDVSPPDSRGFMSFGATGTLNNYIIAKNSDTIIAQVNENTPFVYGSKNLIHVDEVDYIYETNTPLPELPEEPITDIEKQIASHIVDRIPDGATLQIGLGGISNAVGYFLEGKKDLGVHTEMLTNSMIELAKKGVINGKKKTFHEGKITCSFGLGSNEVYEFMHKNPAVETLPVSYVNDPNNIAKNDNFVSINNTLSVDLTGQVASESLGYSMYSGTGGQLDFVRGARQAKNGQSFIALKSYADTEQGKISRITTSLEPGTVVTVPRTDVQYIVTEYGIADLSNKSVSERVRSLISIAHPDFREQLTKEAKEAKLIF